MVEVTGQPNVFTRIPTGLFSIDCLMADHLGNQGIPANTIIELYGPPLIGKSTITVYLAGALSAKIGATMIPMVDLETAYSDEHVAANLTHSGFTGEAYMIPMIDKKKKPRSHEEVLDEALAYLLTKDTAVIIVDSVGAVMSTAEVNNPLGSANMGKRGQLMAQFSRKALYNLRIAEGEKFVFLVNHQYEALGKIGQRITPGGNAKTYAAGLRLNLYNKERFDYGDQLVAVRTDKKRLGGIQKQARGYVYLIPDYGASPHMSAVFDCIISGSAQRKSSGIVLDGTNYGRLKTLRDKTISGDVEWAQAFFNALNTTGFVDEPDEEVEEAEE